MQRAIFLDRDGVINKVIFRKSNNKPESPRSFEEFELFEGTEDFLKRLKEEGFLTIIVTNQPDIARGLTSQKTLNKMHNFIKDNLSIDDIFVCPHDDDSSCQCRKPKPGMLLQAAKKWDIDLKNSFFIGDTWRDVETGENVGCTTILIDYPYNGKIKSDFRVADLKCAGKIILKNNKRKGK